MSVGRYAFFLSNPPFEKTADTSRALNTDESPSMRRLPPITDEHFTYELPLPAATAAVLTKALLTSDPVSRQARLRSLLSVDPALSLWSLFQSRQAGSDPIRRLTALADWLSASAIDVLVWPKAAGAATTSAATSPTAASDSEWPQLVVSSVTAATSAAKLAADDQDSDAAYLLGLVHAADRWLELSMVSAAGSSSHETRSSVMPNWLASAQTSFAESMPSTSPIRHVQTAIDANQLRKEKNGHGDEVSAAVAGALQHWTAVNPDDVDILCQLMRKLQRLQELERDFQALLQREKMAAMKELAYGASHEINNPLANISTRAQTLLRDETNPERRHKLETINRQAFRAHEMITHMMHFARPPRLHRDRHDLVALIHDTIAELAADATQQHTEVVNASAVKHVFAVVDREQLGVAIKAMVINSLEALRKGGRVEISARAVQSSAEIVIRDDGPGISPEVQRHLFDPFFSGREAGRGLGFGLCTCWSVVEQHGGNIDVASSRNVGTTFTIRLPSLIPNDDCLVAHDEPMTKSQ